MLCPHAGDTEWVIRNVETGEIYPCCSKCFRAFALRLAQEIDGSDGFCQLHGATPPGKCSICDATPATAETFRAHVCIRWFEGHCVDCGAEAPPMTPSPCAQARTGRLPEPDDGFEI